MNFLSFKKSRKYAPALLLGSALVAGIDSGCKTANEKRYALDLLGGARSIDQKVYKILEEKYTNAFQSLAPSTGKLEIYQENPIRQTFAGQEVLFYTARHVRYDVVEKSLEKLLSQSQQKYTLSTIPQQNRVVVSLMKGASPDGLALDEVVNFLQVLDTQTPLIGIDVQIFRVFADYTSDVTAIIKGAQQGATGLRPTFDVSLKGAELRSIERAKLGTQIGIAGEAADYLIRATLDSLVSKGFAESLANPYLLVQSGKTNSVSRTVRIPIEEQVIVGTALTKVTRYENIDNKLEVVAHARDEGNIEISLEAETGTTSPFGPLQIPQIIRRRTSIDGALIPEGRSLAIAGFIDTSTSVIRRESPLLKRVPLLHQLSTAKDDEKQKDVVVFLIKPLYVERKRAANDDDK